MQIRLILWLVAAMLAWSANAENADAVRGGWQADVGGVRHIYMLTVRGTAITGTYCTDCSNLANLAVVENGVLESDGLHFDVNNPGPKAYRDTVQAKVMNGELHISRRAAGSSAAPVTMVLRRAAPLAPAAAAAAAPPRAAAAARPAYVPPGPAEALSPEKVAGLWLFGGGPGKQYFMFRQAGAKLFGLVCGPCDDTNIMAPLEGISIDGTRLKFSIVHEANGRAFYDKGPFTNDVTATISRNEMHLSVIPSYEAAGFTPIEMNLLGPIKGF